MIEHPDHTGASANPRAPWNQPDAIECAYCEEPITEHDQMCPARDDDVCEDADGNTVPPGPPEPDWDSMPGGADDDDRDDRWID